MSHKSVNIIGKRCPNCQEFVSDSEINFCPGCGNSELSFVVAPKKKRINVTPALNLIALLVCAIPSIFLSGLAYLSMIYGAYIGYTFASLGLMVGIVGMVLNSRNLDSTKRKLSLQNISIAINIIAIILNVITFAIITIFSF